MTTIQNIHGHEVIQLICSANPPFTRQQLANDSARRWGESARFYTCSTDSMTLDELLEFLQAKGKLKEEAGVLVMDMGQVCNHGSEPHAE